MKFTNLILCCVAAAVLLLAGATPLAAAGRRNQNKFSPLAYSMRTTRKNPSGAVRAAFSRFSAKQGKGWKVRFSPRTALPEAIVGGRTRRYAGGPEQAAMAFFMENSDLIKIDPAVLNLALKKENMGITHLQYQQFYRGLAVEFAYARVHVTAAGEVTGYQAKFEPDINLSIVPGIVAAQAVVAANADLAAQLAVSKTELVIFPDEAAGALKLAWKIRGRTGGNSGGLWVYYIDAQTGSVLMKYDDLRRWCANLGDPEAMGESSGIVYDISPIPTGVTAWVAPVKRPISDQYFWVNGYVNKATTTVTGGYCASTQGKVFSAFKGPYFSVTNFRGPSAHFDNGDGEWRLFPNGAQSITSGPYGNNTDKTYPSVTVTPEGGGVLVKVMPIFSTFALQTGEIWPWDGTIPDGDLVNVSQGLNANHTVGSYMGVRTKPALGPAIESNSYTVTLKTDESGTSSGFTITQSSYMVLTDALPGTSNNTTGSVLWSATTTGNGGLYYLDNAQVASSRLDEVNAFYHLNKARRYFQAMNIDPSNPGNPAPADLDIHTPVMVHASASPDTPGYYDWMDNAYFDFENENMFFGDGVPGEPHLSFALDGTIVRHEYTHLAVHRIYPIINFGELGAISEALSDYFSLASFWKEGYAEANVTKQGLYTLGNFLGALSLRSINGTDKVLPTSWQGEIYNDSLILSQALYTLRTGETNSLDNITIPGIFDNLSRADVLVWAALFYFPDSFSNFHDAMIDACAQLNVLYPGQCTSGAGSHAASISAAFDAHKMLPQAADYDGDQYETSSNGGFCDNNNGPECAADMATLSAISAKITPAGDADYYSLPVGAGDFQVTMTLPEIGDTSVYYAYAMYLYDTNRKLVAEAVPDINLFGFPCPATGECPTLDHSVTLTYPAAAGRYYLAVMGGPTDSLNNSGVNSLRPYNLNFSYAPRGGVQATLAAGSTADNDLINFVAQSNYFPAGDEFTFTYAQLRDHNHNKLELARTNLTLGQSSVLQTVAVSTAAAALSRITITGSVRVQPGFARTYPGVGTVELEIFGVNRMGKALSLGVSNTLNLSSDKAAVTTYNNKLGAPGAKAIIKYELQTAGTLSIKVYTQTGALVKTLYEGPAAGKGAVDWDGTNAGGVKAASGIYFVRAKGPGLDKTDKIAIVR